jgi:hypothetical protein
VHKLYNYIESNVDMPCSNTSLTTTTPEGSDQNISVVESNSHMSDMENMTFDEMRSALALERDLRLRAETALAIERDLRLTTQTALAQEKNRADNAEARVDDLERERVTLNMTIAEYREMRDHVSRALETLVSTRCAPFITCREEMMLCSRRF